MLKCQKLLKSQTRKAYGWFCHPLSLECMLNLEIRNWKHQRSIPRTMSY